MMLRLFVLLMLAAVGVADLAAAQKLTETKTLPLPQALWADGDPAVSGQLLARVAMRKVKYARLLSQRALTLPEAAAAWPAAGVPEGVRRLELAGPDSGLKLSGFNEARLDYLTDSPDQPGCLGFVAELSGNGERAVFVSDPLETVDQLTPQWADGEGNGSVPVASAAWTGKGLRYQLSRLLDRAPDDLWRTSQDGLSTFLQRRFNTPVQDLGAIDVVLLRGQEVQVNAVVALDPGSRARTVLDWYALPKRTFDLGDGRTILRLYVGRHLREIAPGRSGVLLKELSLMFFRQNVGDVERDRNVEKILFVPTGLDGELLAQGLPRNLPARAREVFAGRGELAANLQALGQSPWQDMALTRLSVVQSPQNPRNSQAGQPLRQVLEAARLANVAPRRDVPAIVAAMAERCASFGVSCDVEAQDGLTSQDPLWSLDFQALAASGGAPGQAVHPALTGNLFSSGGRLSFASAPDGLCVESASGALALETGAAFVPSANTRYSLWLELGRERRGLASVVAEAYGPGKSVRVAVKPGFPAVFPELPSRVDGVRLHFAPSGHEMQEMPEMTVTLRRATLNALASDAPRQSVFTARTLFDEAQALTPVSFGESRLKLAPSGPLFTAQWLILDLSTSPWTVKDHPAHLELAIGGKSATLPLPGASSRLAVYLPTLLGTPTGGASWPEITLGLSGGAPGAGLECSRAVLSGQRLATWPQVLGSEGLLQLAGEERALAGLDASGAAAMAASAHWLPMGGANLPEGTAPARFVRNPWLEVEALLLDDASGPKLPSLGRDAGSPKPGTGGGASKAGKWLAGLAAILAGLAAWRVARRAVPGRLACVSGWLCGGAAAPSGSSRAWVWSGLLALVLACGFVLGPEVFRAVALVGTVLAVPVWRALRLWLAAKAPGLAKNATLHYCTGFLAAAVLATALRLLGAAPLSELLGLGGLWLFLAALASQTPCSPPRVNKAGSAP